MTAIEELRKKLDELGIDWDVSRQARFTDHSVIYESNGIKWIVLESPYSGMLTISNFKDELSLGQVIRATIGDEPTIACDDEDNGLLPCPFCGRPATVDSWWSSQDECGRAVVRCTKESYTSGYECATIRVDRVNTLTARRDAIAIWNRRVGK